MALTRTFSLLLLALAVNLLFASGPGAGAAYACSCSGPGAPEKELRRSDAVFSGTVTSSDAQRTAPVGGPPSLGEVVFEVEDSWKGASGESVVVYGQGDEAMCGLDFEEGKTYLVYAFRFNDRKEDTHSGPASATPRNRSPRPTRTCGRSVSPRSSYQAPEVRRCR